MCGREKSGRITAVINIKDFCVQLMYNVYLYLVCQTTRNLILKMVHRISMYKMYVDKYAHTLVIPSEELLVSRPLVFPTEITQTTQ